MPHPMRPEHFAPPESPAVGLPRHVGVLGIPIALTDYAQTIELIDDLVRARQREYVCVCNVHAVMGSAEDPELRSALLGSSVNLPDGQPLVWAINALGGDLAERVYGPELMRRACAHGATVGTRFYLYGGHNQGALVQLALSLRQAHPGLKIVGGYSPPHRPLTAEEEAAVVEEINRARPDVVWVGIGVPKQEKWMARMRDRLDAPVLIGVGAAFDFLAGLAPQAPNWLQDAGLEWAYRFAHEPRRLWRRYARYNPRFLAAFAGQLVRHRRARPARPVAREDERAAEPAR